MRNKLTYLVSGVILAVLSPLAAASIEGAVVTAAVLAGTGREEDRRARPAALAASPG